MKPQQRYLLTIADDYGIGPETSRGILELARRGVVTGSVLLVTSPHAAEAVSAWRQAGSPMELGWHPCLTVDRPILSRSRIPSLVTPDGSFWPLGPLLKRLFLGWVDPAEIAAEFAAQIDRFGDLVGHPPTLVNAHQHVNLFHPVGTVLIDVLAQRGLYPYLRRTHESWSTLLWIPGARKKRLFLSVLGRPLARLQQDRGFPGNYSLIGITDPRWVRDPRYFVRWLARVPGNVVELVCHPGHFDATLVGRDCGLHDGLLQRRVDEYRLMMQPSFVDACRDHGFRVVAPRELPPLQTRRPRAA
jgi:predicted glycoside hydrolase/deacetylase ChbG (UPF0249 family)